MHVLFHNGVCARVSSVCALDWLVITPGVAICIELLRAQTDIDLLQEVAGVIANAAVCEEDGAVIVSRLGGIAPLMKHLQPSGSAQSTL